MMFINKDLKLFHIMGHFQKKIFCLGIGGEKFRGCDDKYTLVYPCCNIKIYLGPLIFNLLFRFTCFSRPSSALEKLFCDVKNIALSPVERKEKGE